tara:strand:- start:449 stop:961 length:513 start_codon:yes stop_codon:yes gene_type:complete
LKKVSFLRHAKSDWSSPLVSDHERCLADRGRKASLKMKDFLTNKKNQFEIVFSSTATRAVETIEIVRPALKNTDVIFNKDLYTFDDSVLIDIISQISDEYSSVLIVGHNPAIHEAVLRLSSSNSSSDLVYRLETKYPTGAFSSLSSDILSWSHTGDTLFELTDFVCPKDL